MLAKLLGVLLVVSASLLPAQQTPPLLVKAGRVIPIEGDDVVGGSVLLEGGLVTAVGAGLEAPAGVRVLTFDDAVICPGFVDGGTFLGSRRDRNETTAAVLPHLRMADGIDTSSPAIGRALRAGITTFHVIPGDADVVGGQTAVLKVDPDGKVRWLRRSAALKLSLVGSAYTNDRAPTSAAGGAEMIRGVRDREPVKAFWNRPGSCIVAARLGSEIELASQLCRDGFRPLLAAGPAAAPYAASIKDCMEGVLLDPLFPSLSDLDQHAPSTLADAGIAIGFCSHAPLNPPEMLRLSAVVARRGGLPARAALAALTLTPARLLGVADRVGSLKPGKDADLLVLTHEPTDPRARILLVVQDGRIVFEAAAKEKS